MSDGPTLSPSTPDTPDRPVRILLVEDNKDIARILSCLLIRDGNDVVAVARISEAERASTESGPFDLLISDLSLPDGSGLDLIRRIGPIPGIAISGYSTDIDVRECLRAGYLDLLAKPVEFAALQKVIRRILGSRS